MSSELGGSASRDDVEQYAIGISFGSSNSSIANLTSVWTPSESKSENEIGDTDEFVSRMVKHS